jgi:HEAT repeat protein
MNMSLRTRFAAAALVVATVASQHRPVSAQDDGSGDSPAHAIAARLVELCALEPESRAAQQQTLLTAEPLALEALNVALGATTVPMARRLAAWALGEANDATACGYLAAATDDLSDGGYTVALATALARCGEPESLRALLGATFPAAMRLRAAITLALVEDAGGRDAVFALYDEFAASEEIAYVALAMGLYGEPSTDAALELMLRQPEWRILAAIALGRQGSGAVLFDLRFALASEDPIVREAALRVLVEREWATDEQIAALRSDVSPRVAAYAASLGER